ncbi:hypothetical protein Hanom_Chr17g01524911 [Helianthus anomalus]
MVSLAGTWPERPRRSRRWRLIRRTEEPPLLRCCFQAPMSVAPWPPMRRTSRDPLGLVAEFWSISLWFIRLDGMEPSPSPSWIVAGVESPRPLPSPSRTSSCGRSRRSKLVGGPLCF